MRHQPFIALAAAASLFVVISAQQFWFFEPIPKRQFFARRNLVIRESPPGGQGSYPPGGQGSYPPGGQGSYPPGGQGSYPPGGQGSYPPGGEGSYPGGYGNYPVGGEGQYPGSSISGRPPYESESPGRPPLGGSSRPPAGGSRFL